MAEADQHSDISNLSLSEAPTTSERRLRLVRFFRKRISAILNDDQTKVRSQSSSQLFSSNPSALATWSAEDAYLERLVLFSAEKNLKEINEMRSKFRKIISDMLADRLVMSSVGQKYYNQFIENWLLADPDVEYKHLLLCLAFTENLLAECDELLKANTALGHHKAFSLVYWCVELVDDKMSDLLNSKPLESITSEFVNEFQANAKQDTTNVKIFALGTMAITKLEDDLKLEEIDEIETTSEDVTALPVVAQPIELKDLNKVARPVEAELKDAYSPLYCKKRDVAYLERSKESYANTIPDSYRVAEVKDFIDFQISELKKAISAFDSKKNDIGKNILEKAKLLNSDCSELKQLIECHKEQKISEAKAAKKQQGKADKTLESRRACAGNVQQIISDQVFDASTFPVPAAPDGSSKTCRADDVADPGSQPAAAGTASGGAAVCGTPDWTQQCFGSVEGAAGGAPGPSYSQGPSGSVQQQQYSYDPPTSHQPGNRRGMKNYGYRFDKPDTSKAAPTFYLQSQATAVPHTGYFQQQQIPGQYAYPQQQTLISPLQGISSPAPKSHLTYTPPYSGPIHQATVSHQASSSYGQGASPHLPTRQPQQQTCPVTPDTTPVKPIAPFRLEDTLYYRLTPDWDPTPQNPVPSYYEGCA